MKSHRVYPLQITLKVKTVLKVGVVFFKTRISEDEKGLVGPHREKTQTPKKHPS